MPEMATKLEKIQDAGEAKNMNKALIEDANMAQKYLDVAGVIFVVVGADQRIRLINKKGCAVLNCEGEEIIGLNWFDNFIPERIRGELKGVFEKLTGGELALVEYYENPVLTRNGKERIIAWHNTLLTDEHGRIYATLSSGEDITERKKAEECLEKQRQELEIIIDSSPVIIFYKDKGGRFLRVNKTFAEALQIPKERFLGKTVFDLYSANIAQGMANDDQEVLESGCPKINIVEQYESASGIRWVQTDKVPIFSADGITVGMIGFAQDITERKKAEDKLKKAYQELETAQEASLNIMEDLERERKKLGASLKEREALLRELHHRVKNNMQLMSSLMRLQARNITGSPYSGMFKDALDRIKAMSLIHEKLYGSEDIRRIGFRDYIRSLAGDLFQAYDIAGGRISLKTDVETPDIDIDKAIPMGLIINELITNSIKYAFPGDRTGEIRIAIRPVSENEVELLVADNGVGITGDLNIRDTKTLGMQMVITLAEDQLRGSMEISRNNGTEFRIRFKI